MISVDEGAKGEPTRAKPYDTANATRLIDAGNQALRQGNIPEAASLFQQAAYAHPKDERVWSSLLYVMTDKDDRRVCLENILKINPDNHDAARKLALLDHEPEKSLRTIIIKRAVRLAVNAVVLTMLFLFGILIGIMLNVL